MVGIIITIGAAGDRFIARIGSTGPLDAGLFSFHIAPRKRRDCCTLFGDLNWISTRSLFMRTLIGAAVVAGVLAFAGPAAINSAAAAPLIKAQTAGSSDATDISARRYYRHYHHYGYRVYDRYRPYPAYYARPYYYRPYPYYAPAPFVFGFGFGPLWWD
jgi:hypothetical protein